MTQPPGDDLETRVTHLERAVADLHEGVAMARTDADAARVLSAGADRDVSDVRAELRAHTRALNALRETQVENGHRLDRVESRLDRVEVRLDRVEARLDRVEARLDRVEARLESLEDKVDRGFATMSAGMAQIVTLIEGISGPGRA